MKKLYRELTKDQKSRNVRFSSQLRVGTKSRPAVDGAVKEVKWNDPKAEQKIKLLKDDEFFRGSQWNYNVIRGA